MRTKLALLLALTLTPSCRAARDNVEVMGKDAPPRPPSGDYLQVGGSVKTTVTISAITFPPNPKPYDRLDLSLLGADSGEEVYGKQNYRTGDAVVIAAHKNYEIVLSAVVGETEMYSTKFCSERPTFRSEEGRNTFTAALCANSE